jgi:hypothetical protein
MSGAVIVMSGAVIMLSGAVPYQQKHRKHWRLFAKNNGFVLIMRKTCFVKLIVGGHLVKKLVLTNFMNIQKIRSNNGVVIANKLQIIVHVITTGCVKWMMLMNASFLMIRVVMDRSDIVMPVGWNGIWVDNFFIKILIFYYQITIRLTKRL